MSRVILSTCGVFFLGLFPQSGSAQEPFFSGSLKEACAAAAKTKRIVMIDFYTTWCVPCKKLDQTTWKHKEVQAWLEKNCISLKINAEKEKDLAKQLNVASYPTIVFLKADGAEIDRIVGFYGPGEFIQEAREAVSGKDAITRAKEKLVGKDKDNPTLRMAYGDVLARRGRHEEALKEYVWCLQEGNKHDAEFTRPALFMQMQFLAKKYEPAQKLLKERSDAARAAITKGDASEDHIEDFCSILRFGDKQDEIIGLYDDLRAKKAPQADRFFDAVVDLLVEKRRYKDVVDAGGDFSVRVRESLDDLNKFAKEKKLDAGVVRLMKAEAIKDFGMYYEALVGADRLAQANALRDQLLALDGGVSTYATLVRHARRAEKERIVEALLALAKSSLTGEEYKQVVETAK